MGSDEILVLDYLKRFPATYTNASQICKEASTPHRFAGNPEWAQPALRRLAADGHLETDESGHYRITPALFAKYTEHFLNGQRLDRGSKAVVRRIMEMAPEDDEKTFDTLIREALSADYANEVGLSPNDQ